MDHTNKTPRLRGPKKIASTYGVRTDNEYLLKMKEVNTCLDKLANLNPEHSTDECSRRVQLEFETARRILWMSMPPNQRPDSPEQINAKFSIPAISACMVYANRVKGESMEVIKKLQEGNAILAERLDRQEEELRLLRLGHAENEYISLEEVAKMSGYGKAAYCKSFMLEAIASGGVRTNGHAKAPKYLCGDVMKFWRNHCKDGEGAQKAYRAALVEAELKKARGGAVEE